MGYHFNSRSLAPAFRSQYAAAGLGVDRAGADDVGTDGVGAVSDGDVPRW